jgi:cell division protein FtsA
MYLVTIGSSPAMNLRKAVEKSGYKVGELVLEPLASALSVLTDDEKELGVCLVEMGAGTTDIAIFHEGKIRHLGTVGYGGGNVTSDIVHGLGVTAADAERLKELYGCAWEPMVDHGAVIKLPSTVAQGDREIPRELLAHIIHQRTAEIFELVARDVEQAGFIKRLSAGVVVTGGAAAQPGTAELASHVFGTGARVGEPGEFLGGLADSVQAPRFSTVVGLVQYGAHRVALGGAGAKGKRLSMANATPSFDGLAQRFKTRTSSSTAAYHVACGFPKLWITPVFGGRSFFAFQSSLQRGEKSSRAYISAQYDRPHCFACADPQSRRNSHGAPRA